MSDTAGLDFSIFSIYTNRFIPSRAIVNLTRGFLSTPPQVCQIISARKYEREREFIPEEICIFKCENKVKSQRFFGKDLLVS